MIYLDEMRMQIALAIENIVMDVFLYEGGLRKEGSPYQVYVEKR